MKRDIKKTDHTIEMQIETISEETLAKITDPEWWKKLMKKVI